MKVLTLPKVKATFIEKIGKTAIECNHNGSTVTVWANGDRSMDASILVNITIHEIGDTFVATKDSSKLGADGFPLYKQGDTVTRQTQSYEFKSFAGNNSAAQFAQSASAFGLQLNVIMQ